MNSPKKSAISAARGRTCGRGCSRHGTKTSPRTWNRLADQVVWNNTRLVGFTSTFQQNSASLALARLLKERYPNMIILFGGANFDGDMGVELVRSVDWIDAAVAGEGDLAFPRLLSALATGDDPSTIPGLIWRTEQYGNGRPVIATDGETR